MSLDGTDKLIQGPQVKTLDIVPDGTSGMVVGEQLIQGEQTDLDLITTGPANARRAGRSVPFLNLGRRGCLIKQGGERGPRSSSFVHANGIQIQSTSALLKKFRSGFFHKLSVPKVIRPPRKRGRGKPPTYGKQRLSLAKRAGQQRGWQQVECVQYGQKVTKTIKTFLPTWHPAGGLIRVVLVREEDDWLPYFSVDPQVSAVAILEAMADRGAIEQTNKDVKEVWGAGQQQVRKVYSNEACFNLNLWMYTLVEAWACEQADEVLVDRRASPWDSEPRRPSHADKRKALQKEILGKDIEVTLSGKPSKEKMRALVQRLLGLAI